MLDRCEWIFTSAEGCSIGMLYLILVVGLILTFPKVTHQPYLAQRRSFPMFQSRTLPVNPASISPSLSRTPSLPPVPAPPNRRSPRTPKTFCATRRKSLFLLFPGLVFHTRSATSTEATQPKASENENGKARAVDDEESRDSAQQKPRLADVAGASGSSILSPVGGTRLSRRTIGNETEQVQTNRSTALSSVEYI
jgi:hypothetical protein